MGKYIDAEEFEYTILHEDVEIAEHRCKDYESYINGANQFRYQVKNAIRKAPAADLVPQAEVEQLRHKYELAVAERAANVAGFIEQLSRSKSKVAKEIFAEIERFMLDGEIGGKYATKVINPDKYAELKKKYTGGSE